MKISLIQPSRNNLKYLKWSYDSIRKNQGDHEVEICVADDFSDKDNTWEWCQQTMKKDPLFKAIRNKKHTPAAHKYCKFDLSSKRFGLTTEKAFGRLISDW